MLNKNKKRNLLKNKIADITRENEIIYINNLNENNELKNINHSISEEINYLKNSKNALEEKYNNLNHE